MVSVLLELLALFSGFALLAKGSDSLVDGGERIALQYNVSPLTVGLTVVAWGTSLPELVITSWASYTNMAGASLGTVVGSNVANLGLVLGVCALILPATIESRVRVRDAFWLLISLVLVFAVLYDGVLTRMDGGILLAAYFVYEWGLLKAGRAEGSGVDMPEPGEVSMKKQWSLVLLGSLAIAVGARLVMYGGEGIALRVGMSEAVVGLTVFAVGTSLPELFAGVSSARRGHAEIGLGNVLGSNVFNVLAALGCAAAIRPIAGEESVVDNMLHRDIPIAIGFSLVLLVLPFLPKQWGRAKGMLVFLGYIGFVGYLLSSGQVPIGN